MKTTPMLLFLNSLVLFAAIIYTIFVIDEIIQNIMYYNKLPFGRFEIKKNSKTINLIPLKNSLITLLYWWIFYMGSNLIKI